MYPTIMRLTHCTCTIVFLARQRERLENVSAVELVERERTLPRVRRAVQECRGCDLWRNATHALCGKGPVSAQVMLVGEQPGDKEDGHCMPFVGPAGRVLEEGLDEAGIERDQGSLTPAVKSVEW